MASSKFNYLAGLCLACTAFVSGCGGGDSGGGNNTSAPVTTPTPAPTPSPTATPTPTPTSSQPSFVGLGSNVFNSVAAHGIDVTFAHRGNEIDIQQSLNAWPLPFSSNLSILRNSEIGSYTIRATGIDATFKDSDLLEQNVSPSTKFFKIGGYKTTGSSSEEYLSLYRSGEAGAEPITLNYVTLFTFMRREWRIEGDNNPQENRRERSLEGIFGFETADDDMPHVNAANFRTYGRGQLTRAPNFDGAPPTGSTTTFSDSYFQVLFRTDFATGEIEISAYVNYWLIADPGKQIIFEGAGSIDPRTNRFSGQLIATSTGYSGTFDGAFYGPSASEFGFRFFLNNNLQGMSTGAVVGKR